MKKTLQIVSILVGVVLLVSGYAKSADAAYFSDLLGSTYSWTWLSLLSPLIILTEILLGVLLLVGLWRKCVAWITAFFLMVITAGYLYGWLHLGMHDCGCFGHLYMLNLSPWGTLTRNILMMALLVWVAIASKTGTKESSRLPIWKCTLVTLALTIGSFATGYTFPGAQVLFSMDRPWQHHSVADTPLKDLNLSPDSTYLVFAFSYHCPFCMNAVGNVQGFQQSHMVDRVIGLAALEDSVDQRRFQRFYGPDIFGITPIPRSQLNQIASSFPKTFLIHHDTIQHVWVGEVPPAIFFVKTD